MSTASTTETVVRLPNWVGDVCMALPALGALCAQRRCRLFGRGWAVDLLAAMGWDVQRLPTGVRAGAAVLRASGARDGVLFTNSFGSALQSRLAGVAASGYRAHWRSWLLGHALAPSLSAHEVERFWELAQHHLRRTSQARASAAASGPLPQPPPQLGLQLHARHRDQAAAALAAVAISGPYSVLCPLASGLAHGHSKIWPAFPLLCRGLVEQGVQVVCCPGPGEESATAAALPGAIPLPDLGLGAYAAILADARYVVANDSGPLHLAAAVNAPVVGLFGVSDPHRTRPWSQRGSSLGSAAGWPSLQDVILALKRLGD